MNGDVEEILRRELGEVASGLPVPARPPMPRERVRTQRLFRPLLVAAVTLIVVSAVAVVSSYRDGGSEQPATPPTGSPTDRHSARPLTAEAPTVPYVFDGRLYVGGERLSGSWWTVNQAGGAWAAQRDDGTWWWGTGAETHAISGTVTLQPRLSPDGGLLAVGTTTREGGQVLLIDTRTGESVNTLRVDATGPGDPNALGVVAVTQDTKVFLDSESRRLMWLAAEGDETVDLATTAPDQWVQGSTAAGLIVFDGARDGESDASYLAEASDSGTLSRLRTLPGEDVEVNPSGTWLAHAVAQGGESQATPETTAQTVNGSRRITLPPPDDRQLIPMTWEDDDLLLAELHTDGSPTGLARCSIRENDCLVIVAP